MQQQMQFHLINFVIFKKADKQISEEMGMQTSDFRWQNKDTVSPVYEKYAGWVLG